MSKLNFFTGMLLKEVVDSPINGEINIIKSLAFGTHVQVGNLTQSGGVVANIWERTLKKFQKINKSHISNILILGLGGGSVAKSSRKLWPGSKIVGVDIDPKMVEMGMKYLGLEKSKVNVVIADAYEFLQLSIKKKDVYDLICVDLYIGDEFPDKFEKEDFIRLLKRSLTNDGSLIVNRLYYDEKRKQAMKFGEKLLKYFVTVKPFFPQANIMFICRR